jgi:hypothetical protein
VIFGNIFILILQIIIMNYVAFLSFVYNFYISHLITLGASDEASFACCEL